MNEDYGNLDQMTLFAYYCFNAGATVVPMRPIGHQTNEVVLDNTSLAVSFSGPWSDEVAESVYYGQASDSVHFRYAAVAGSETATATYTPTIPVAGFYPVYTWVPHGANRTNQLYRIRHPGGEAQTRVPHQRVGRGWVYLGTYYFNAGSNAALGAVAISNLQPGAQPGSIVIADALRFGNGMGSIDRGTGVSGFPREEECSRYWVQNSIGQGQSTNIYDVTSFTDQDDNVGTPPRMAREMNREQEGNLSERVYVGFHSNAGGGRGALGLYNNTLGDRTPNQFLLADTLGTELNQDMAAVSGFLEVPWASSGNSLAGSFGEIRNNSISSEFDATIVEVAFHDNPSDALLLRDPKARSWIARAAYHGVIRYMNALDNLSTNFLPEPPFNVQAVQASNNQVVLSWSAPVTQAGSGAPTGYVVYRSPDGFGFGSAVNVAGTSLTITNLAADIDYFFRVAAVNAGGESFPSEVVGCRRGTNVAGTKFLIVNAFDRFDRTINLRQTPAVQNYKPPGHDANSGVIDRVIARGNNAFDYVGPHGLALGAAGRAYDSCQNEAVANGQVALSNYQAIVWACGQESVADETFSASEQSALSAYLAGGGGLFASGSDMAWDLDRSSGPTAADRAFLNNLLHARLVDDTNDNALSYSVAPVNGAIFAGKPGATFDSGTNGTYAVRTPDVLTTNGNGALRALSYGGISKTAAIQYDGSSGGGRVVLFGFPFESLIGATARNQYMASIVSFLGTNSPASNSPPAVLNSPQSQFVVQGSNATLTVNAIGTAPLSYQWWFNGFTLAGFTSSSLTRTNAQPADSGNYQVTISNSYGMATSGVAQLTVTLPIVTQTLFNDNFDGDSSPNWLIHRSSLDTRVTFNYDYANDGIAAAPKSSGTTRGVKFEANLSNGLAAAVSISPVGQSFSGDYRLRFDMWINANGPFPVGGTGSTEHFTAGVATSGNQLQWTGPGSAADGHWFAIDGDGGTSDISTTSLPDFAAQSGANLYAASSGVYAAGTALNARGNGHPYYASTLPAGKTPPPLQQATFPQQTGSLVVGSAGFAWHDIIVDKGGNTISWFIDGLRIASITNAVINASNIFLGYWDFYPSVSDNPALSFGLVDNVSVDVFITNVPPFITAHPQNQTAAPGGPALLSVSAGGTAPLSYQWQRSGTNLAGATQSSYAVSNVQPAAAGTYAVVVSNLAGTVTSSNAVLSVVVPQPPQFVSITMLTNSQVRLVWTSATGAVVSLERSATMSNWTELIRLTNQNGTVEYIDGTATNQVQRFYRGVLLP
jgi:hypothetical protein